MAQVSFEFSMLPNKKASGKAKKGDKGNRLLCQRHTLFCLLSTYHWGTNSPSLHAILMGLSIRHWSKDWVCDLSKANQWTSPESDIRMLKESSNISTRTAKRICEPRILMAMFSNSWKTFIYKSSERGQPTEQRRGERWRTETDMMTSFSPWNQLRQSQENFWASQLRGPIYSLFPLSLLEWGYLKSQECWLVTLKTGLNIFWPCSASFSDHLYFQ